MAVTISSAYPTTSLEILFVLFHKCADCIFEVFPSLLKDTCLPRINMPNMTKGEGNRFCHTSEVFDDSKHSVHFLDSEVWPLLSFELTEVLFTGVVISNEVLPEG